MSDRNRVAVVTPREARLRSAESWAPLIADRADLAFCRSPEETAAQGADLVAVDECCPHLDEWIVSSYGGGAEPASIVVFGTDGETQRGAIPWGEDGAAVLATICDLLERRRAMHEADAFVAELRESTSRLDAQRRRFARLVLEQAETLRGANVQLSREVESLTRLQSLARFFAAPGPGDSFADRLAEVVAHALAAEGAVLYRWEGKRYRADGRWRMSARNAARVAPGPTEDAHDIAERPCTRKGHTAWWLPVGDGVPPLTALGLLVPGDRSLGEEPPGLLASVGALVREGLETRTDLDEIQALQQQNDRILRTLRGGLLKVDGSDRVTLANPACAEMLGTTVAEMEGRTLEELFPRDVHLRELLASVRRGGRPVDDVETFLTDSVGGSVAVSVRASRLIDASSGRDGILVLLSDVSRRRAVEAERRKVDRLTSLGRLSAGVAHEIRNPLAGIRTTAELLRDRLGEDEDRQRFVDVILEETERLDRIVGSLLQFARPPTPRPRPLDIASLLQRGTELAAGKAVERRITIRLDVPDALPCPPGDPDQILQVILNLLLNAIEASPPESSIRVVAGLHASVAGEAVRIAIEDRGPGVSPAARDRLFDPFFSTKPGGTGLGLSISQHIIRAHGGMLRLEDKPGGPSVAFVTLPLTPSVGPGAGEGAAAAAGRSAPSPQPGGTPWPTS